MYNNRWVTSRMSLEHGSWHLDFGLRRNWSKWEETNKKLKKINRCVKKMWSQIRWREEDPGERCKVKRERMKNVERERNLKQNSRAPKIEQNGNIETRVIDSWSDSKRCKRCSLKGQKCCACKSCSLKVLSKGTNKDKSWSCSTYWWQSRSANL